MADEDPPNIIPFGKHKGKTIQEVQIVEPGYLDWLEGQPWFRDKFVILHQTIINRGAEPEETPDHNALQVLFLNDDFCLRVIAAAGYNTQKAFDDRKQEVIAHLRNELKEQSDSLEDYQRRHPDWETNKYSDAHWKQICVADTKDKLLKTLASIHKPRVENRAFEVRGIDVLFEVPYGGRFAIEIKPVVGDDYPAVLRQMNVLARDTSLQKILFLERYIGVGATREQFIEVFKQAGIAVIFRDQVQ